MAVGATRDGPDNKQISQELGNLSAARKSSEALPVYRINALEDVPLAQNQTISSLDDYPKLSATLRCASKQRA